ncbi:uncharacterized protein LOC131256455 [Magnolia sinica]|uniref:uncharacterized protein LOC131256455 n=1 Tax=Magnolia sinica TaxID=86752 RepID=UPI00265B0B1C|nr:uncharacterized protein LOC131256455 [Magnolia sinica]
MSDSILRSLFQPVKTILYDSFRILCKNPISFISITTLTILPLSLLHISLAFASQPLEAQISYKASIIGVGPIAIDLRHVYDEIRSDALSLVRLKAVYFLPSYVLSLLAAITAVSSAALSYNGNRPSRETVLTAIRMTWPTLFVTSICVYVLTCSCSFLTRAILGLGWLASLRQVVAVLGAGLEVFVTAVSSLGMVVSILEERSGFEALMVGWGLMEGRRFSGVVLGGLVVLSSGGIGWGLRFLMDGKMDSGDLVGLLWKGTLIGLFCLVVLWSFVATTVLYCECRKLHGIRTGSSVELVEDTP